MPLIRSVHVHVLRLMSVFFLLTLFSPLTASAANLTGLSLAPSNPTVQVGNNIQLTATGSYDDGKQQVMAQAKQVSAGVNHACALSTDGTIQCWGNNSSGQLGNGTTTESLAPVTVSGISTAVAVSAGYTHTCAALADGTLRCWGGNYSWSPVVVSGISTALTVSAGGYHTCAVLVGGFVKCWGGNAKGQLGNGTTTYSLAPVTVIDITAAVAVSAGFNHSCAVLADGTARCWGDNYSGQLGNGPTSSPYYFSTPVNVYGINSAVAVSASRANTCAVLTDGTARCWGDGLYGQLGADTTSNFIPGTPAVVIGISTAVAISAGSAQSCAVLADGTTRCWGKYASSNIDNVDSMMISRTPVAVSGISTAVTVSVGGAYACAVLTDGALRCWGYNPSGVLGNGTNTRFPVAVSGISTAVTVSAGQHHSCALLADGTLRCWGNNDFGQLGNGTTTYSSIPLAVSGISTAVAVSAGSYHTCALLVDGTIKCWGRAPLGIGMFTDSSIPLAVSGISTAVSVSAGTSQTCAVLNDGTVRCWGSTPVAVSGLNTVVAVSPGYNFTCALLANGTVWCWGNNINGQLGNGTTTSTFIPTAVWTIDSAYGTSAVSVDAGMYNACAVLADGRVTCWGSQYFIAHPIPVILSGLSTAVTVSAGDYHACAVLAGGAAWCWGDNYYGQLGDGMAIRSFVTPPIPSAVIGLSTAVAISAGGNHTCAALADGTLRCWGDNGFGQLGNGMATIMTPTSTLGYFPVSWSSNDPIVASVNGSGKVQALRTGTALITVSMGGFSASTTVTVVSGKSPIASDVNVTTASANVISWTPKATDPDGDPLTCRIGAPPQNGTATVASNCSSGTYQSNPGFIGTDTFTYIANDGQFDSNPGTVTVAVTEPQGDQACLKLYPVTQFSQTGKSGTLSITFTGNITSHTNKEVKVCPGTTLSYQSTSTQGPVICKIKNSTTRGSGTLRIKDHLKCTDKPVGKDKVNFKVKSGVK